MSAGDGSASSLAGRSLLAAAGLVVALGLVEVGVRVVHPQAVSGSSAPALLRGQFREPGVHPNRSDEFSVAVHVNSHRFVDDEWGPVRAGIPRVAVIGDSFVEAAQVELEQGFGRVLEATLTDARGGPVEVHSFGVPGAGTATALGLLEQHALPQGPQLVVLGFLVSNDVLNNHPLLEPKDDKPFLRLDQGQLVPTDTAQALGSGWRVPFLWQRSHAWRLLGRTIVSRQLTRDRVALGEGMPIDFRVHDPAGGPVWDEAWEVTDALVGEMAARCREHGMGFAVVIFPSQVESTVAGREAAIETWPELASWDLGLAVARATTLAEGHGSALDLTPALSAAQHEGALYYARDGHWTPRGHRVAAEATAPFLLGLLPPVQGSAD